MGRHHQHFCNCMRYSERCQGDCPWHRLESSSEEHRGNAMVVNAGGWHDNSKGPKQIVFESKFLDFVRKLRSELSPPGRQLIEFSAFFVDSHPSLAVCGGLSRSVLKTTTCLRIIFSLSRSLPPLFPALFTTSPITTQRSSLHKAPP